MLSFDGVHHLTFSLGINTLYFLREWDVEAEFSIRGKCFQIAGSWLLASPPVPGWLSG
jgi:hypothetical protein